MAYANDLTIYCGDWKLVINPDIDIVNYLHIPMGKQTVLKLIDEDNFIDAWRVYHEHEKETSKTRLLSC